MIISLQVIRGLNIRLARTLRWVDWLCGILPTTESHTAMSFPLPLPWNLTLHCSILLNLVSCLPWNLTLHCSIWLNGVLPAMESDSALFYSNQRCPASVESDSALFYLTQRSSACRGILLCIVLFYSVVSCSPRISTPQLRALRRVWLHDVHGVGIRSMWCICFRLIWLCPWNRNSLQNYFSLFINRPR